MIITESQKDIIDTFLGNDDRDTFLGSSVAADLRDRGVNVEAAWDQDLVPPSSNNNQDDYSEIQESDLYRRGTDLGDAVYEASKIHHDHAYRVNKYENAAQEEAERGIGNVSPRAFAAQTSDYLAARDRSDEDIATYGIELAGNLNYNMASGLINWAKIDDMPREVALSTAVLLEQYDALPNWTWAGTSRMLRGLGGDPFTYVGGVAGLKVVQQLLRGGGMSAAKNRLMKVALGVGAGGAVASEGAAYAAFGEYLNQRLKHGQETPDSPFVPDWNAVGTAAGLGGGLGAGLVSGAAVARQVPSAVRAVKDSRVVRDLFDAPAEAGTTLTSGVDPTPAIEAALNYAGRKTRKSGQVVGAPPEITSQRALTKLRRNLESAAREGEPGRFWYERSGQAILDALGGDRAEADKLAQAIAITSSATGVDTNFDFALQAYLQHKAGQPVRTGRFPANMSKRIQEVFDGKDWEGRKTNNFYVNLMRVIDPSKAQGVTTDMWMMRAFGFKNPDGTPYSSTPTDAQYTFVEQETKRIADQLGWEPQQVQAAIWVANKARAEGKDVADAAFDYSDALLNNKAQVSWESIPGRTGNHLPEMFDAPYEVQQEYHVAISKAFLDEDGNDFVAKELGLPTPGDFEAPGYFEGKVSPGTQTELAIPRQFKGPKYGQVEPAAYDLMQTYAAIRGIAMKQDGVGFHRPFYNPKLSDTNGVELRIGRKFSENETEQLANILSQLSGHNEYNPIASRDGVRIINFDFLNYDNKQFVKLVQNAVDSVQLDDDLTVQQMYFASQNGYVGNDWSVNKNGEEYTTAISGKGRSDIQRKIRSILPRLQTRIDEVDADFSERYGFTRNNALNEQYRDEKITQAVPEPGIAPAAANEPIGIQPQQQE